MEFIIFYSTSNIYSSGKYSRNIYLTKTNLADHFYFLYSDFRIEIEHALVKYWNLVKYLRQCAKCGEVNRSVIKENIIQTLQMAE